MKHYLKILWLALTGRNPYQEELDEKVDQLAKAAENVSGLQDQLYAALEKWDKCQMRLEAAEKQTASLQQLVENLRDRIKEKEAAFEQQSREYQACMEQMKADYQKRIDEYNVKIDELTIKIKATNYDKIKTTPPQQGLAARLRASESRLATLFGATD